MQNEIIGMNPISLQMKSVDEGLRFFNQALGFKINFRFQYDDLRVIILEAGKARIEMWENGDRAGIKPSEPERANDAGKRIEVSVRHLRELLKKAQDFGYEVLEDIYEPADGIRKAVVGGPENISIRLIERDRIKAMKDMIKRKLESLAS